MSETAGRILRAAVEAAAVHGVTRLSVLDVAKRAGLSRPTLYKHFPSKEVLVAAAVQREAATMAEAVRTVVDGIDDPQAALEAGILAALHLVRDHPLLDRVVRTEPEVLVPLLTTDASPVMGALRLPVEEMVVRKYPELDQVARRRVADLLVRLLISYALSAPDDPPDVVASMVAAVLVGGVPSLASTLVPPLPEEAP
jgi:AcrR family transcriptional regulator